MTEEKEQKILKKKEITCFRYKKDGHYSNECKEELPKIPGGKESLLISKEDIFDKESLHEDQYDSDDGNI